MGILGRMFKAFCYHKSGQYSYKYKRKNEMWLFNQADMQMHVLSEDNPSKERKKNITEAADANWTDKSDQSGLKYTAVIMLPEYGCGCNRAKHDMKRMEKAYLF